MNSISTVASNALKAFNTSQQVTAHNMANLNTEGFKASSTVFQENGASGVTAFVSSTKDTVDISREATNLLSNANGYKANLRTLKAADEMARELFSIKV